MDLVVGRTRTGRAGQPKVRSGCRTCKVRRVKCDEAKPSCLRCVKFGAVCGGYAPKSTRLKKSQLEPAQRNKPLPLRHIQPSALLKSPSTTVFANDQEFRYFRLFCERTAASLAGHFKGTLWNRLVLQACENTPPIRHAIIAIGALDKTLDAVNDSTLLGSSKVGVAQSEAARHHQFALQQYGRAITQMQDSLAVSQQDFRAAVILCLLTVCFESLNGDMQSALAQIRNGLKIIKDWKLSNTIAIPELENVSASSAEGTSELIQAFTCLDNNSIMIIDAEPIETNVQSKQVSTSIHQMPLVFASLDDARVQFEYMFGQMLHWVASAYAWGSHEKNEVAHRVRPSPSIDDSDTKPLTFAQLFSEQRGKYLESFRKWQVAFEPLRLHSRTAAGRNDFRTATVLQLRWKAMYTSLSADHFQGETCYDACTKDFQEIIELAEGLIQDENRDGRSQSAVFTFDDPLISSLYTVILKCRDRILRRRALALLRSRPRRDGVMDSALMAKVGTLQMQIEEAGCEGKYVPEHTRIRGIKTTYDMLKRTGHMKYLQMVSSSDRTFVVHHIDFSW